MLPKRAVFDNEHALFRDSPRRAIDAEIAPYFEAWEKAGMVDWYHCDALGQTCFLCPTMPEDYGGFDTYFRMHTVVTEELTFSGFIGHAADVAVYSDVCLGYLLSHATEEQKSHGLPRIADVSIVCAIVMTEPGDGDDWVTNGAKTFISNGKHSDILICVCRTIEDHGSRNMTLIVVEADREGFRRGRSLDKLGQTSAATSELFIDDVRVPVANTLWTESKAMSIRMSGLPQERQTIAVTSIADGQKPYDLTFAYAGERQTSCQSVASYQTTRHRLAELKTELTVGWAVVDQCIPKHLNKELPTYEASMAKHFGGKMRSRVMNACVQLHGGYGFMREYEVNRLYVDARVQKIYGGTTEIMKELTSRIV